MFYRDYLNIFFATAKANFKRLLCLLISLSLTLMSLSLYAANDAFMTFQPHLFLLLNPYNTGTSSSNAGFYFYNPDPNSGIIGTYVFEESNINLKGNIDASGNVIDLNKIELDVDNLSFEFAKFSETSTTLMVTNDNGISHTEVINTDSKAARASKLNLQHKDAIGCYTGYALPNEPDFTRLTGEIEIKECGVKAKSYDNYHVRFSTPQLIYDDKITISSDKSSYQYILASAAYPFHVGWFDNCVASEGMKEITKGFIIDSIATLTGVGAVSGAAGLALKVRIAGKLAITVATLEEAIKGGGKVLKSFLSVHLTPTGCNCKDGGDFAKQALIKFTETKNMQIDVITKQTSKTSKREQFTPQVDSSLPKLTVNFTAPDNGTGIPPGIYSGTGEWVGSGLKPGHCLPGFKVTVDNSGNVTSVNIEECTPGSVQFPSVAPLIWTASHSVNNPIASLSAFDVILYTANPIEVENECNIQNQYILTPSGRRSSYSILVKKNLDTGALEVKVTTFAYTFTGQAQ